MDDTRAAVKFVTWATVKAVVLKAPAAIAAKLSDDPPASTNTAQHHHQYSSPPPPVPLNVTQEERATSDALTHQYSAYELPLWQVSR